MKRVAIAGIFLGVVIVGLGYWISRPKVYEAKWVYARAKVPITIENGEIVLPPDPPVLGTFQDQRRFSEVELEYFKKHGWQRRTVLERFLGKTNIVFNVAQVSNAFESVRWQVRGNREMAVVEMSAWSESKELALAVMKSWADNVTAYMEYENVRRTDLALMQLRSQRKHLLQQGMDTSDKDKEIAEGLAECRKFEWHIYTVKLPYVCNE